MADNKQVSSTRSSQMGQLYFDYHKSLNNLALSSCNNQNNTTCIDREIFNDMKFYQNQMECAPMVPHVVASNINDLEDIIETNILIDKFNTSYNIYLQYYYVLLETEFPSRNDIAIIDYQISQILLITSALIRMNERYFNRISGGPHHIETVFHPIKWF